MSPQEACDSVERTREGGERTTACRMARGRNTSQGLIFDPFTAVRAAPIMLSTYAETRTSKAE